MTLTHPARKILLLTYSSVTAVVASLSYVLLIQRFTRDRIVLPPVEE